MRQTDPHAGLALAREQADLARLRFSTALGQTRRRLAPGRLRNDALVAAGDKVEETKQSLRQAIRRHPVRTAASVAGLLAIMFWRPARLIALYGMRGAQFALLNRRLWSPGNDR